MRKTIVGACPGFPVLFILRLAHTNSEYDVLVLNVFSFLVYLLSFSDRFCLLLPLASRSLFMIVGAPQGHDYLSKNE